MANIQIKSIAIISIIMMSIVLPALAEVTVASTAKPPPRKYPIRTMLGNMYHRIRNNRTGYLLIPPLLRLAYQYGPNIIDRMSSVLGFGGGSGAAGAAAEAGLDGLVNAAMNTAVGGGAGAGPGAAAGQALGALAGGLGPQIPFGAAAAGPMGFGPRPVFFRRRRRTVN